MPARIVRMKRLDPSRTDEPIQDDFDALMTLACHGDRRALGVIAIALTPAVLAEARAALGGLACHAPGVVADALTTIAEGGADFDATKVRAMAWLKQLVRKLARAHRAWFLASDGVSPERTAPTRRARARHAARSARRAAGRTSLAVPIPTCLDPHRGRRS